MKFQEEQNLNNDAKLEERKQHYIKQLEPFAQRLHDWKERYPHTPPPLHVDEDGNVHWVNRKLRRKFKR